MTYRHETERGDYSDSLAGYDPCKTVDANTAAAAVGAKANKSRDSLYKCDWQGSTVVAVHNLGEGDVEAALDLGEEVTGVRDLLVEREHTVTKEGKLDVKLSRYGYLWLKVERSA